MTTIGALIITVNVLLYATAFILGFVVGRMTSRSEQSDKIDANDSFFKPKQKLKKAVEIDEKKFVTTISTNDLEKKGEELGSRSVVSDDVGASASKLAMLKKK